MLETALGTALLGSYGVSGERNGENWLLVLMLAGLGGCPILKHREREEKGRERENTQAGLKLNT